MPDPMNWSLALPYYATALAFGYLLGSIPFGLLLTKLFGLGDVRSIGSGNIGATNVLRTGNKLVAGLTLACDLLKGTIPAIIGLQWGPDTGILASLGAFLGHVFPVWLKFKGGKGVATYIGVLLGLFWPAALIFCGIWLAVAVITRYSSMSSLLAAIATPVVLYGFGRLQVMELFILMSAIVVFAHRSNISRLVKGEETKIGAKG